MHSCFLFPIFHLNRMNRSHTYFGNLSLSLSLSLTHTHTHTHSMHKIDLAFVFLVTINHIILSICLSLSPSLSMHRSPLPMPFQRPVPPQRWQVVGIIVEQEEDSSTCQYQQRRRGQADPRTIGILSRRPVQALDFGHRAVSKCRQKYHRIPCRGMELALGHRRQGHAPPHHHPRANPPRTFTKCDGIGQAAGGNCQ